jgi:hypothetical protein
VLQIYVAYIMNIVLVLFLAETNILKTNTNKKLRMQIWELNSVGTKIFKRNEKNKECKSRIQTMVSPLLKNCPSTEPKVFNGYKSTIFILIYIIYYGDMATKYHIGVK